jgi:G:T/U-mismatch repair DNA glycosylase
MLARTDTGLTDARQRHQCSISNNQNCRRLKSKSKRRNKMATLDRVVVAMISTQSGYDCCALGFSDKKATGGLMEFNHGHRNIKERSCVRDMTKFLHLDGYSSLL